MGNQSQLDTPKRRLGGLDLVCLGWNSVIGSGIFLTQGQIYQKVGPWGPLMFLIGGLACLPVGLCFGRLARLYPGTGGSALFAHEVFGRWPGFLVGWVMWLSGLIGGATVSVGFAGYLCAANRWPETSIPVAASAIVLALAAVNLLGSRGGAWSNNLLAISKLVPLLLACLVALVWCGPAALALPSVAAPSQPQWLAGLLAVLYTYSGFEEIALPAGEVKDSERQVRRAIITVLITSSLLYMILQGAVSCQGTALSAQPLVAAFSSWGALAGALALAAGISFASVNASIAFTTPRSLWTLARHGWMPPALTWLSAAGAPQICIAISSGLTLGLIWTQRLDSLIALSVLASLLQQLSTSLACWKVQGWATPPGLPHLAVAVCLLLLLTSQAAFLLGMGVSLVLGACLALLLRPKGEPTS